VVAPTPVEPVADDLADAGIDEDSPTEATQESEASDPAYQAPVVPDGNDDLLRSAFHEAGAELRNIILCPCWHTGTACQGQPRQRGDEEAQTFFHINLRKTKSNYCKTIMPDCFTMCPVL
jgi:hypothetical protein